MAAEHFASSGGSVESLEQRYRHLDDRVGRLGQEVASIGATLQNVSHTLDTISKRVNEPERTQWSSIIAGCAFVASLGYSALMPVKEVVQNHADRLDQYDVRTKDSARLFGQMEQRMQTSEAEHARTDNIIMQLSTRIYEMHGKVSAADQQLIELGEKLRDVDMAGSRKWIPRDR